MLSSLAPARRRLVLALAALVAVAAVAIVVAATVGGGNDDAAPVSQQTPGPVVLVPGYGGSTTGVTALVWSVLPPTGPRPAATPPTISAPSDRPG